MHSGDQDLVLFEGKLAHEFGVSRTPIRQVIQSLAAESLVEVRSGVGTIAPPLLPERRANDLAAYSAILGALNKIL
jgi:DNA-binding GntR family transcriptional regulator